MDEPICLPSDWKLPESWAAQALQLRSDFTEKHVAATAKRFFKYYHERKTRRDGLLQWEMTWRKWVRNQSLSKLAVKAKKGKVEPSINCPVCGQPGTLSHNTMAGPYYCREHFSISGW